MTEVFHALDLSGDDKINYSEFLAAMLSTAVEIDDTLIDKTFDHIDVDKSGTLEVSEIKQIMGETLLGDGTEEDAAELMKEADLDGDGKITKEEFKTFMEQKKPKKNRKRK